MHGDFSKFSGFLQKTTERFAHARSVIEVPSEIAQLLLQGDDVQSKKGPVFATAIIAGAYLALSSG